MTRVVDIEARAMERDTYRPMFRVTDIERRRERKIVWRPNDGPGMSLEERQARSEALMAKLVRKPQQTDSMVTGHVLLPLLKAIADGVKTQKAIAKVTKLAISTIAARCSEASRKGYITSCRAKSNSLLAIYSLTKEGTAFIASYEGRKPQNFVREAVPRASPYAPPATRRDAILTFLMDGEWRSAAELGEEIGTGSNRASAAVRRCVEAGLAEQKGGYGVGTKGAYRITDKGREYVASVSK